MKPFIILIIEDEGIVAESIREFLTHQHFHVVDIVSKGEQALKKFDNYTLDAVLMDITLGGKLDGIETARLLLQKRKLPIVFLTANSDPATMRRLSEIEPYGYVSKPFKESELAVVLDLAIKRFQSEQKLAEREQLLSTILNLIEDAIIATDSEGRIKYINPIACKLTAWGHDEALGKNINQIYQVVSEENHLVGEVKFIKNNKDRNFYTNSKRRYLHSKDGNTYLIADKVISIKDENSVVNGMIFCFQNITQRKVINDWLEERRRGFQHLVETLKDGFVILNEQNSILEINQGACDYLGYSRINMFSLNPDEVANTLKIDYLLELLKSSDQDKALSFKHVFRRKDGSTFPINGLVYKFIFENEKFILILFRNLVNVSMEFELFQEQTKYFNQIRENLGHIFNKLASVRSTQSHEDIIHELAQIKHSLPSEHQ